MDTEAKIKNPEALALRVKISEFEDALRSSKLRLYELEGDCEHEFNAGVVIGKNGLGQCSKKECIFCGMTRYENN